MDDVFQESLIRLIDKIDHWNDGNENSKTIVWGYRWDSSVTPTGADMVKAIAKADPALTVVMDGATTYGAAIGGFGYDLNGDGAKARISTFPYYQPYLFKPQ